MIMVLITCVINYFFNTHMQLSSKTRPEAITTLHSHTGIFATRGKGPLFIIFSAMLYTGCAFKVSKGAKVRNRYN